MSQHTDISAETLVADLMELIAIPSVVDPTTGTTVDDVNRAGELAMNQLRAAGLTDVRSIEMEPGVPRLVYAEYRVPDAPEGTPTVLCYGHFDVVPAQGWAEAFRPVVRDTPDGKRVFGRGAADDKSAIVMHCGAIKAFNGHPPVHLKIVLEGEEEISGEALERYLAAHPELFQAEVLVVADNGNSELGCPTLTSSLRGTLRVDLTVETLTSTVHSGAYGGPVPDAFFVLTRLLAALYDERGAVAVPGLAREHWDGVEPREELLRRDAKLLDGVRLQGSDSVGSRLFGQPAITVLGLDGIPPLSRAANILAPKVTARIGMRIPPTQDPGEAIKCLTDYLDEVNERQCRAKITITVPVEPSAGWKADLTHPGYRAAERALAAAYPGKTVRYGGMGASIPLVNRLQAINPESAILVWGTEEPGAMIHSDSESASVDELVKMTRTERNLLADLGGVAYPVGCAGASRLTPPPRGPGPDRTGQGVKIPAILTATPSLITSRNSGVMSARVAHSFFGALQTPQPSEPMQAGSPPRMYRTVTDRLRGTVLVGSPVGSIIHARTQGAAVGGRLWSAQYFLPVFSTAGCAWTLRLVWSKGDSTAVNVPSLLDFPAADGDALARALAAGRLPAMATVAVTAASQ